MRRRRIDPPGVFASRRYGFSQAVAVTGGTTVYVSGQVGWDANEQLVGADLTSQTAAALDNLARVLNAAGGSLADVAALRIYVVEDAAGDLGPIGEALRTYFDPERLPAATWLVVAGLAGGGLLVEIEATAVLA